MYNLGNCYIQLGEIGKAITYYQRALKITPQDKELKENLAIAESRIVTKPTNNKKSTIQLSFILNVVPLIRISGPCYVLGYYSILVSF